MPARSAALNPTSASATLVNSGGPSAPSAPAKPKKAAAKRPGSGIPARKVIRILVWVRRASQIGFVTLFLYFLAHTAFRGTFTATAGEPVRLTSAGRRLFAGRSVRGRDDLAQHPHGVSRPGLVARGAGADLGFWAGVLRLDLPVRHAASLLRLDFFPSRYLRGNKRVESNKTHWWQAGKYYIMWASLGRRSRGQRDRRLARSDLRRGAHDRHGRGPGAAILRRAFGHGDRQ